MLWEALNGRRPFAGETPLELALAVTRGTLPRARATVPRRVQRALRRGLAVDPAARWPDMTTLLRQLQGRRRGRVVALGVTALAISTGVVVGRGTTRAPLCEPGALASATGARLGEQTLSPSLRASIDRYAEAWDAAHRDVCQAGARPGQLAQLACLERGRASLMGVVEALVDGSLSATSAARSVERLPGVERCADASLLVSSFPTPESPRERTAVESLRTRAARLDAAAYASSPTEVDGAFRELVEEASALAYAPLELELELARLEHAHERLARRRQATQAEVNSLQLRAISEGLWLYAVRSAGLRISSGGGRRELALAEALAAHLPPHLQERELLPVRLHAARVFIEEGRFELARETLAPCRALVDESLRDTPEDFELVLVESLLQWRQGVYDAAASSLRARLADVQRALGEDSFLAVNFLVNLTAIEQERGRPDEAIELMQETARRVERVDGPDALRLGPIFNNLGLALMSVGRLEEAERAVRRAGVIWTALHGADHPQLAFVYTNLGDVYAAMGRDEEAAAELARALEIRRAGLGEQHPYTAYTHLSRARLFLKTGDPEAASAEATAALETRAALYDESSWLPAEARVELGRALLARGELDAARAEAALARAAIERSTGAPAELGAALTRLEAALR